MDKKGQMLPKLIILSLAIIIYIFSAPILSQIISESITGLGSATVFVIKLFLWVLLLILIAIGYRILTSGEGFLA